MNRHVFAASALALALSIGSALAADLPSKNAPPLYTPPLPPPPLWTGFYVGVNAGYTWSNSNTITQAYSDSDGAGFGANALIGNFPSQVDVSNDGFIGGGQIGYNYQIHNNFVVGVEADIQGVASGSNSLAYSAPAAVTNFSRGIDYLGTVRGRLGYLVTPTLLVYGTGGLAYGQTNLNVNYLGAPAISLTDVYSDTRVGYAVGGGVEWLFHPGWSAKAEYLYYDLGSASTPGVAYPYTTGAGAQISTAQSSARFDGHVIRAGLNYHFNWFAPAPVVAKY